MARFTAYTLGLLGALIVWTTGCSAPARTLEPGPKSAALLFGQGSSAPLATQMARNPWPATDGYYATPEETVFVEYYYNVFGGNAFSEQNYPRRTFYSFRSGARQR